MADLYGMEFNLSSIKEPWKGFKVGDKAYWIHLGIDSEGVQYDEMRCGVIDKLIYDSDIAAAKQIYVEVVCFPDGERISCSVLWLFKTKEEAIDARVKCYRDGLVDLECVEELQAAQPKSANQRIYQTLEEMESHNILEHAVVNALTELAYKDIKLFTTYMESGTTDISSPLLMTVMQNTRGNFNINQVKHVLEDVMYELRLEAHYSTKE